jgi:hypothetical protein
MHETQNERSRTYDTGVEKFNHVAKVYGILYTLYFIVSVITSLRTGAVCSVKSVEFGV